jgi:hypothetical protein
MRHFVYRHLNPVTFDTFYVGIGCSKKLARAYSHTNRNKFWHNYVSKHGILVDVIATGLTKDQAAKFEIELISFYGKRVSGGQLVNLSDGGENSLFGIPRTKEHNQKIGQSQNGKIVSAETRAKQRAAKKGVKRSPEHCAKIKAGLTGLKRSKETIERLRISNSRKRKPQTAAHIEARRNAGAFHGARKKVLCINNGVIYESGKDAAIALNISDKKIGTVCNGNRHHTHGYKFTYA